MSATQIIMERETMTKWRIFAEHQEQKIARLTVQLSAAAEERDRITPLLRDARLEIESLRQQITELQKKCRAADELAGFYGNPLSYQLCSSVLGHERPTKDTSEISWIDPGSGIEFSGKVGGVRARQFQKDYPATSAQDAR